MILLKINYDYLIASIIVAAIYFLWIIVIKPKKEQKEIEKKLLEYTNKNNYKFQKAPTTDYDYIIDKGNQKYLLKIVKVPSVSAITINNKTTWNLHFGGSGAPGKRYLDNRYLNELVPFLKKEVSEDENKIIVIYKDTNKIQRYQNESDIVIVKEGEMVFDYRIIIYNNFENQFNQI